MTEQEEKQYLFDKSLNHIKAQGKPAVLPNGSCQYKLDGLGCAAAPFIVEHMGEMEGHGFISLVANFKDFLDPIAVKHVGVVGCLQGAHDSNSDRGEAFMEYYLKDMKRIADTINVTFTE
jgi:hypothetical protein